MKYILEALDYIVLFVIGIMFYQRTNPSPTGWQFWLFFILLFVTRQLRVLILEIKNDNSPNNEN